MRNETRSLNYELGQGMVTGRYKKMRPSWGGVVEPLTERERSELSSKFDMVEKHPKLAPDGTLVP